MNTIVQIAAIMRMAIAAIMWIAESDRNRNPARSLLQHYVEGELCCLNPCASSALPIDDSIGCTLTDLSVELRSTRSPRTQTRQHSLWWVFC